VPVDPTGELTDSPKTVAGKGSGVPSAAGTAAPKVPPKIMSAFKRYRIAAFVVGWGLLILCAAMVLKYVFDMGAAVAIWGPIHGALFVVYVIIAFDLAYKDRWSPLGTVWVLVAGTIPFVSFVAERQVQRKVLSRQRM
jgi:integral membrane protein